MQSCVVFVSSSSSSIAPVFSVEMLEVELMKCAGGLIIKQYQYTWIQSYSPSYPHNSAILRASQPFLLSQMKLLHSQPVWTLNTYDSQSLNPNIILKIEYFTFGTNMFYEPCQSLRSYLLKIFQSIQLAFL